MSEIEIIVSNAREIKSKPLNRMPSVFPKSMTLPNTNSTQVGPGVDKSEDPPIVPLGSQLMVSPTRTNWNETKTQCCGWTKSILKPRETIVGWYLQGNHHRDS